MRTASRLITSVIIAAGVAAIAAPDRVLALRALVATQAGLLIIAAFRIAVGVTMIMAAPSSRWPKILQAVGAVVLLAGLATPFFGVERTRLVVEWEAAQGPALMRVLGAVLLAFGGLLTVALSSPKGPSAV